MIDMNYLLERKEELEQNRNNFEVAASRSADNAKACAGALMVLDEMIAHLKSPTINETEAQEPEPVEGEEGNDGEGETQAD